MRKLSLVLFMFAVLYWHGTNIPIKQYDKTRVVCGEFKGKVGYVNYTWKTGEVDVISNLGDGALDLLIPPAHWYVTDYNCLEKVND